MLIILLKSTGIWFVIVIAAVLNGLLREKVLVPSIGGELALPASGIILSALVFSIAFVFVPFIGAIEARTYVLVGFWWVVLTLAFEFLFGHFVMGKSWQEIVQVFNIKKGDVFIVVLIVTAVSPWLAARIRGLGLG